MKAHTIFGPPGTGKTTEMLRRVEEARDRGYGTNDIGFFSFTRAAADEAAKRLGVKRSDKIATLHSLCFRAKAATPLAMVDAYKLRKFGAVAGVKFSGAQNDEYGEQMEDGDKYLAIYNLARSRLTSPRDEYYGSDDRPGDFQQFTYCLNSYEAWKKAYGYIDFTDLLESYARDPVNHGGRILFFDEAQDLSPLQWRVVDEMLKFEQVREVVVAGDDDQAIYEWAGADPHGMASFGARHDAEQSVLAQSYRVPAAVHEVARGIVGRIDNRVKKKYRAAPRGGEVVSHGAGFHAGMVSHGEDALILCRSHSSRKEVESELINARVPYRSESGKPGLFDSMWADAMRALARLESGRAPNKTDIEVMAKAGTPETRAALDRQDFRSIVAKGKIGAFRVPFDFVEFFRDADLSATPTVRLSTIHGSKGKEAHRVILHTGITARTDAGLLKNPDQEHRVWYVGVTRAKERLDIVGGCDNDYEVVR